MNTRRYVQLSALLLALGCAPAALQMPTTPTPTLSGSSFTRTIQVLTDLDTVRDVAAGTSGVYVATDRGVLAYASEGQATPTRITSLPSLDVRALAVDGNGNVYAATARGVVRLQGSEVGAELDEPAVGDVVGLSAMADGTLYACGVEGLARHNGQAWESLGDAFQCTGLFPTPEGNLWVGTSRGVRYIEGDIVREHAEGRGMPAGWVRSVVPTQPGQAYALVQNTLESYLAWFDGTRWYGYTVADFEPKAVGLSRVGDSLVLITDAHLFRIDDAATTQGIGLKALTRGERMQVLGYRLSGDMPSVRAEAQVQQQSQTERNASRLAAIPPNHTPVEAPGLVISPLGALHPTTPASVLMISWRPACNQIGSASRNDPTRIFGPCRSTRTPIPTCSSRSPRWRCSPPRSRSPVLSGSPSWVRWATRSARHA